MQYQLYNIVDVKLSKFEKLIKILLLGMGVLTELLFLLSFISNLKTHTDLKATIINLIIFPLMVLLVYVQIGKDKRDKVVLYLTFDDNYITFYYPNIKNKRFCKPKTIKIMYSQIYDIIINEELGIVQVVYADGIDKQTEVIYLQEDNKKELLKMFNLSSHNEEIESQRVFSKILDDKEN